MRRWMIRWVPWLATALVAGCVVVPAPRPVMVRPAPGYDEGVMVDTAPPAPYAEVVPLAPFAGAVWIGGYWGWSGGRHHWVGGRWEQPRPGYGWRAHAWHQDGGRWRLHEGGWVRR